MRITITVVLMLMMVPLFSQTPAGADSVLKFSMAEAQAYAVINNPVVVNANLDLVSAKKKVWETTAMGLPQVTGKYSYQRTLEQSALIEQFKYFGVQPGQTPPEKDYKNSSAIDVQVSQLIFSGAYLVGLQTSKVFKNLSEYAITKSESDIREAATNSYMLVLTLKENKLLMDTMYLNTEKIVNQVLQQLKQGFVEDVLADQMTITLNNIRSTRDMLDRQIEIAENLLKFQLGVSLNKKIVLTDNIETLTANVDYNMLLSKEFTIENMSEYKLLITQEKLMVLNLKLQKSNFLPTVAGFYAYHKQLNNDYPDFQGPKMLGVSVTMPLFTSGQNIVKVGQARVALDKTHNSNAQAFDGLKIEFDRTRSNYISSLDKYNTEKQNLELSRRIYNKTLVKINNGVSSNFELSTVQNQYLQTQTSYYTAISELIAAKAKLEKMLK